VVAPKRVNGGKRGKNDVSKPSTSRHTADANPEMTVVTDQKNNTALIVVDVQRAFDEWEARGQRRNNPQAVARISDLLAAFRDDAAPIFHIRHEGTRPTSSFLPDGTGFPVKDEARERNGEPVIVKRVNSAFIGTDLESRLRAGNIRRVVVCGATTNHCVETTTRMAGNLGFDTRLVRDATWTFDRTGPDGDRHSAEDIHAMTLANLNGEFATIVTAGEAIAALKDR
jgi:nicotinamidase-related amidase